MTTKSIHKSPKSDRSQITRRATGNHTSSSGNRKAAKGPAQKRAASPAHQEQRRDTKHAQLLQLLSRPDGANIEDMMQATGWQQHSVRGFLAGTVKKKMGLALTSSKSEGDVRRYRIATGRGR